MLHILRREEELHSFAIFGLWVSLCDLQMCAMYVGFPGWSNYRMSEKSLINYMERRIRGEIIKFPDDYFPLGI